MASSSSAPTSPTSPSPSSSAISIIRPGKSILKKPPPPQRNFFSLATFSKLLPTSPASPSHPNGPPGEQKGAPLKRAHFILPQMSTIYPISSASPPYTPNIKEEKRNIELREAERRKRIVRSNSFVGAVEKEEDEWWSMDKVETFYTECCAGREETANPTVSAALRHAGKTSPRSLDLSGIQLTPHAAAALADILTIEWGLRKLVLRECDLDDMTLKPLLHALLITNTLLFLSIASNRAMKVPAFKLVGAYISKAKTIQYLDLSQNALEKKAVEYIVSSLGSAPPQPGSNPGSPRADQPSFITTSSFVTPSSSLLSLRLDDCSLRQASLEVLAHAVRTAPLRNISLRHNRISANGAVALALMIRDYPDSVSSTVSGLPPASPTFTHTPLQPLVPPPATPPPSIDALNAKVKSGPIPPPPRHPIAVAQASPPQTTYTPYIPKSRRNAASANSTSRPATVGPAATARSSAPAPQAAAVSARALADSARFGETVPVITSSPQGGVTTRHPPLRLSTSNHVTSPPGSQLKPSAYDQGPSAALLDKVRALDNLPRLGALRTLDLRGNDIRGGIMYIAQVLKRNRTLKLLNLSENKIDVTGLMCIAEALKYNSCLETLDLSKNPCCGPGLEGIQSLRTAFTLNTSLKRLFLSSTSLTSSGAIALAEFLPESTSLLHLDLTVNNLDYAGVLALSVGLKANFTMRCLDLNIPAGNEEMARLCREILNCCVRNTEEAEKSALAAGSEETSGRGAGKGVWSMIEESELAKSVSSKEDVKVSVDVLMQARECKIQLDGILSRTASSSSPTSSMTITLREADVQLTRRTKNLLPSLVALIQTTDDPSQMIEMLTLNDDLTGLLEAVEPATLQEEKPSEPNGHPPERDERPPIARRGSSANSLGLEDVHTNGSLVPTIEVQGAGGKGELDDEEPEPFSPKVDKGKGKAMQEPSPVLQKLIMGPSFSITDSDEEEEERRRAVEEELMMLEGDEGLPDVCLNRSRSWVEEEGEVFRKGQALLSEEEMESEYAGEELRQGLLEAELERPPARQLDADQDPYDEGLGPDETPDTIEPLQSPISPTSRPYMVRQRSTSFDNSKT
ncbi:hypothetical protein BU17DRAFT_56039 [Hysterangium stoloniferum]|nr:hypothetical protein BU17DRAFT_56039 [Hysterangium stoloniferum]